MKKKLLGLLVGVGILIAGVVGVAIYKLDSLIERFRPDIQKMASAAVKRDVQLGAITTSIFPSFGFNIQELKLGEKSDAFSLKNVSLHTQLLPLLSGNLAINSISVAQPEVTLIRDASGAIRVAGLPKAEKADATHEGERPAGATDSEKNRVAAPSNGANEKSGLTLTVDKIAVTDVLVRLLDEASKRSHTLVSGLTVNTSVALHGTTIDTPALSVRSSILEHASLKVDGNSRGLGATDASADIKGSLSGLDLAKLLPLLETMQIALPVPLAGSADATFHVTGALATPTVDATLDLKLNGEPIQLKNHILKGADSVSIEPSTLDAFGGSLKSSVKAELSGNKAFAVTTTGGGLLVERALNSLQMGSTVPVAGNLTTVDLKLNGAQGPALMQTLAGSFGIELKDGALKGQNLAAQVLKLINNIPSVSGSLYENVPADQQAGLQSPDTAIQGLVVQGTLGNATLGLTKFTLDNPIFTLEADGKIGFDTTLDLNASMLFSKLFSAGLASRSKTIEKMLDAQGRFVVPLQLKGKASAPIILPNVQKLLEGAGQKLLEDKAKNLLGKALGGNKEKGLGGLLGF